MRIFVSIACFLDPDVVLTIKDCLNKAADPRQIVFGVCLQTHEGETFFDTFRGHPQVRSFEMSYKEAKGPTYARYHCSRLREDEDFFLQIDAHTRFVPDWDRHLIDIWMRCDDKKALITCFPLGLRKMPRHRTEPLNKSPTDFMLISKHNIRLGSELHHKRHITPTYNLSAAFIFGSSEFISEVPLDPHLPFSFQKVEQQFYAVRLFTHGWNLYMPDRHVVFTNYDKTAHYDNETRVYPPTNAVLGNLSWQRALYYYGILDRQELAEEAAFELEKYGMGISRSVDDFFELHGHYSALEKVRNNFVYENKTWSKS